MVWRNAWSGAVAALVLMMLIVVPAGRAGSSGVAAPSCAGAAWSGTWSANPSDATASTQGFSDQSLRMILTPHLGGDVLRIHLSNRFGSQRVTFDRVTVARRLSGAVTIPGTLRPVTFAGRPGVTIPVGADVVSDPVGFRFAAFDDLAVSLFTAGPTGQATDHATARQTSYLTPSGAGDHTADGDGAAFTQTTSSQAGTARYFVTGADVLAPGGEKAVAAFGDSITDGYQGAVSPVSENPAGIDANGRWPDDLQRRLIAAGRPLVVLNDGISGNRVLQDGQLPPFGPRGTARFRPDALAQEGVTQVIVLEGINDIGQTTPPPTVDELAAGYRNLIVQAHAAGVGVLLGTLTPAGGTLVPSYGDAQADALRQDVNAWIRTSHAADGVVDFDAAVRDPSDHTRLNPAYDGSDHLHLNLAGYQAMANAIDLGALRERQCASTPQTRRPTRCAKRHAAKITLPASVARRLRSVRRLAVTVDGRRARARRSGRRVSVSLARAHRNSVTIRIALHRVRGPALRLRRVVRRCV